MNDVIKNNQVLVLSGQGVKGIAELVVLTEIEESTGKSITELFPIIIGTSFGGLIAGLLTIPQEQGSSVPKYSAKKTLEIFKEAAPKIFPNDLFSQVTRYFMYKYSQKPLEKILEEYFGDILLSSATSRLVIPLTNLNTDTQEVEVFDSHNLHDDSRYINLRLKDVLLATTADLAYFKSVTNVSTMKGTSITQDVLYRYADGRLGTNYPAYKALKVLQDWQQQQKIFYRTMVCIIDFDDMPDFPEALLLTNNASLSNDTGMCLKYCNFILWICDGLFKLYKNSNNDGKVSPKDKVVGQVIHEAEDVLTVVLKNHSFVSNEFIALKLHSTTEIASLDNASPRNISALEEIGRQCIQKHAEQLKKLYDNLSCNYNQKHDIQDNTPVATSSDKIEIVIHNVVDSIARAEESVQSLGAHLNE